RPGSSPYAESMISDTPSPPSALRAGISTFDLSRYMGASLTMIDRHYGHLASDGREHAIRMLDELSSGQRPRSTLLDAAWPPNPTGAVVGRRWGLASVASQTVRASAVCSGRAMRLALRVDGVSEPRHTCRGDCAEELLERSGRAEVRGLSFERGSAGVRIQPY